MRTIFGIAAALTLTATVAPTAAQAQYYDQGYSRYDNGRGYDNYHGHDWRDRQRWNASVHARNGAPASAGNARIATTMATTIIVRTADPWTPPG
jgi:hypothetical protein